MSSTELINKRHRPAPAAIALSLAMLALTGSAFAQTSPGAPAGSQGPAVGAPQSSGTSGGQQGSGAPGGPAAPGQSNGGDTGAGGGGSAVSGQNGTSAQSNGSLPRTNTAPDSPNFDLARTIQSALASSANLIEAQKVLDIDRHRADATLSADRPNVSADGSATRFDAATKVAIALPGLNSPPFTVLENHTEDLSINVSENLDLLGVVRAQTSQVRLQALADSFTVRAIANSRILQAQTAYFDLLRAIHQVNVAQTALRNAQEQQSIANKLYLGQVGQKIDLLRANTQVANAQQGLTAAENNRDIARANFNDLVGRPLSAPVVVQDVPGVTVGVDIPTGAGGAGAIPTPGAANPPAPTAAGPELVPIGGDSAALGFTPFPVPTNAVSGINIDQAVATAVTQRPEVLQSAALVRASNVGVRIARSGLEPTFSLSASGNYYPTTSFQYPRQRTAALTFAVSIPLYDGGKTRDLIAEAKSQTENAQTTLDSTREDVTLQVRQSYLNLATAAQQIGAANTALQQAIGARELAQVRYEGQVGLYLEVTDAQAALVQAENAQVDAVYNYLVAKARFDNALGAPRTGDNLTSADSAPAATPASPMTAVATMPTQAKK